MSEFEKYSKEHAEYWASKYIPRIIFGIWLLALTILIIKIL